MAKPDLRSTEGRRQYGRELGRVARGWRYSGLAIVMAAFVGLVLVRWWELPVLRTWLGQASLAAMALGWVLASIGIGKRTAYHRRRMAERD